MHRTDGRNVAEKWLHDAGDADDAGDAGFEHDGGFDGGFDDDDDEDVEQVWAQRGCGCAMAFA